MLQRGRSFKKLVTRAARSTSRVSDVYARSSFFSLSLFFISKGHSAIFPFTRSKATANISKCINTTGSVIISFFSFIVKCLAFVAFIVDKFSVEMNQSNPA